MKSPEPFWPVQRAMSYKASAELNNSPPLGLNGKSPSFLPAYL